MKPIAYATVGTSWITQSFIDGTVLSGAMKLAAVYSRDREKGEAFAAKNGVRRVFTDLREMAACPEIEAVYIASPNRLHVEQSRLFLEHGKHVICEKSVAARPERVQALQELADRKGLIFMEAIMFLHLPQLSELEAALDRIGPLSQVRLDFSQRSSRYDDLLKGKGSTMFDPRFESGALMDLGVYCVYPALYLFGKPERMDSAATFVESGSDGAGSSLWTYPDKQVVLTWSKTSGTPYGSEFQGKNGVVEVASISKLTGLAVWDLAGQRTPLVGERDKAWLMSFEGMDFVRYIRDPGAKEEYRRASRLCRETAEMMYKIRCQAGIRFPTDDEPAGVQASH